MYSAELIECSELGNLKGMANALKAGADVNGQEPRTGITALHAAASGGHIEAVKVLLAVEGVDPNLSDHAGRSAADLALEAAYDEIATLLLSAMATALDKAEQKPRIEP